MISDEQYLRAYKIRKTEQALLQLFSKGQIAGTIHTCVGQEFTGIAVAAHLANSDIVFSNHRCHGHYLARYDDLSGLIGELLGKASGVCKGYGGSQHIYRKGFYSSGIQGGMAPLALGAALSIAQRNEPALVVLFIGDGTLGQGVIYEVFNAASKFKAPLLFVLEDNQYSQSTAQAETLAGSVRGRAQGFGIAYEHASTDEPEVLSTVAGKVMEHVRTGAGPALLHVRTFRLGPHSKGDDHRDPREIQEALQRDPLHRFLETHGNVPQLRDALSRCDTQIDRCIGEALDEGAVPHVIADSPHTMQDLFVEIPGPHRCGSHAREINRALHQLFDQLPNLVFLGEDVRDPYGGAFKVSKGLSTRHPDRVINMPISEATIVGAGLGLALHGRIAICEIMFGDFMAIAFDQILNHVAKVPFMYHQNMDAPLLIRAPMGAGRGYGSTHSQSLEKYLAAVPNIDVYLLHGRVDVHVFYTQLVSTLRRPAIVLENKVLYGSAFEDEIPSGYKLGFFHDHATMHQLTHTEETADVTVICFGGISSKVEAVARSLIDEEVYLDIFMPVLISRWQVAPLIRSARGTGKVLIVEEGTVAGGLSAEVVKQLAIHWPKQEGASFPLVRVIGAADLPIPAARELEDHVVPSVARIQEVLLELFYS